LAFFAHHGKLNNEFFMFFIFVVSIKVTKKRELETKNINTRQRKTNYIVSIDSLEIVEFLERDNKKSDLTTDRNFERWSG
jgi:hypothetical protein